MRWDSWDALASKKLVRMEESGRVDEVNRAYMIVVPDEHIYIHRNR